VTSWDKLSKASARSGGGQDKATSLLDTLIVLGWVKYKVQVGMVPIKGGRILPRMLVAQKVSEMLVVYKDHAGCWMHEVGRVDKAFTLNARDAKSKHVPEGRRSC
jgi:hypothetical protein